MLVCEFLDIDSQIEYPQRHMAVFRLVLWLQLLRAAGRVNRIIVIKRSSYVTVSNDTHTSSRRWHSFRPHPKVISELYDSETLPSRLA